MKGNDEKWQRLIRAAHLVSDFRDATAPMGFATRLAALSLSPRSSAISLVERFSLRALGVSCLLALLGAVGSYVAVPQASASAGDEVFFSVDDPVSVILGGVDNE